jgi:hypothetical protein
MGAVEMVFVIMAAVSATKAGLLAIAQLRSALMTVMVRATVTLECASADLDSKEKIAIINLNLINLSLVQLSVLMSALRNVKLTL